MLWAMTDAPVADVYEFAVLGVLGQHADIDGRCAYPSKATIADHAKIDAKSAQRALDRLEERRLIGLGDQTAAEYIRADRRPVVYDVLIPLSWLLRPEHAERVRKFWKTKQRPPLTKEERPDLAAAPTKAKRSDAGKPRGDSQSPRTKSHGGTTSPARGDSQSATGGLQDPQTYVVTGKEESLSARLPRQTRDSPAAPSDEREIDPLTQKLMTDHGATEDEATALLTQVRAEGRIKSLVSWSGSATGQLDIKQRLYALRAAPQDSPATTPLPDWCGRCNDGDPVAERNPRFRTLNGLPSGEKCHCHPDYREDTAA